MVYLFYHNNDTLCTGIRCSSFDSRTFIPNPYSDKCIDLSMAQKAPDAVQRLLQLAKPTFVNGRWRKPAISARKLADIRKGMVVEGVDWDPKPLRDRGADKPLKLTKWERERDKRYSTVGVATTASVSQL